MTARSTGANRQAAVVGAMVLLAVAACGQGTGGLTVTDNRGDYPDGRVPAYALLELRIVPPRACAEPFAPYPLNPEAAADQQVDAGGAMASVDGATVEAELEGPGGLRFQMPGFWDGEGWRVRFTPTRPGRWRYRVSYADRAGTLSSPEIAIEAAESEDPGFVRAQPGARFFAFERGGTFIPRGNNLVKTTDREVIETWAQRLAAHRMNAQRVWLHPHYTALEWLAEGPRGASFVPDAPGLGRYCLRTAAAMDAVIEAARRHRLYAILCLDDTICYQDTPHGEPRIGWEYNPYRAVCRDGIEFFTNATAERYYKRRLRYIVARWGYTPHLFAWELHNEVDWPYLNTVYPDRGERWRLVDLADWHRRMADYLRRIDPYRRPVSTSTASNCLGWGQAFPYGKYDDRLFMLHDSMDFANHHLYEADEGQIVSTMDRFAESLGGRPMLIGEWGLTPYFDRAERDVTAPIGLHNAIWVSLMSCGGTPLHWFWDKYYEIGGLEHYRRVAEFLDGEDPLRDGLRPIRPAATGGLQAYALAGDRRALGWVWDPRSRQGEPDPEACEGAVLMADLRPGAYRVEYHDPWGGPPAAAATVDHPGGELRIALPRFVRDLAFKVVPGR